MAFEFRSQQIPDVVLIHTQALVDHRGTFTELFRSSQFRSNGLPHRFVQDNHSHSRRGVLRGLHYQLGAEAQAKLVCVLRGEIYDVAVDLRRGSPSFGQWIGLRISAGDGAMLFVPVGFAHGFQTLSQEADVVYKVTEEYSPEAERGIRWNDGELAIPWPIQDPSLSSKDRDLPPLSGAEYDFVYQGQAR